MVGDAGVSIEVFADLGTSAEEMFSQAKQMFSWILNAYIKYPCTHEGLRAAEMSVRQQIRVNITLCFSQEQAAAVYVATKGSNAPVYVSPFVGRLDDRGEDGIDLIKNIKTMYKKGDGHVHVLSASIRHLDHLLASFALDAELVTVPAKVIEKWATSNFPLPDRDFTHKAVDVNGKLLETNSIQKKNWILVSHGRALTSLMSSQPRAFRSLWLTIVLRSSAQHKTAELELTCTDAARLAARARLCIENRVRYEPIEYRDPWRGNGCGIRSQATG